MSLAEHAIVIGRVACAVDHVAHEGHQHDAEWARRRRFAVVWLLHHEPPLAHRQLALQQHGGRASDVEAATRHGNYLVEHAFVFFCFKANKQCCVRLEPFARLSMVNDAKAKKKKTDEEEKEKQRESRRS